MPAYSGGNRWVGIVSLAEPETPPSLAQMAGVEIPGAVKVRAGLWVDAASLREVLGLQRKAIEKRQRRDVNANRAVRHGDRLAAVEKALAELDAPQPHLSPQSRKVLLAQIGFVVPSERTLQRAEPPKAVSTIDLGQGRVAAPDDVRQMVRALGKAYHLGGMDSKAKEARQVVKDLRNGDAVALPKWLKDDLRKGLGLP